MPLHSTDLLTLLDEDRIIRYDSPAIKRIYGYEQDELVGHNVTEYFHPNDHDRVLTSFEALTTASDHRVDTDSLPADVDPDDVGIHRYDETRGAYVELDAQFVGEHSGQFNYEVETPGFSEFAITVTDAEENPPSSPSLGLGGGSGSTQPVPGIEPQPEDDGPRDIRVDVTNPEAGSIVQIDGESANTGEFLSGVGSIHVDSLSLAMATDRPFSLDISTYESDPTPSYDVDRLDAATEARLGEAAASFETQTSTVSAGYVHVEHDLTVDELSEATIAFSIDHAYLEGLGVDSETATVTATVENRGQQFGEYTVELAADSDVVDSQTVELAGQESTQLDFKYTSTDPGEYTLSVGGVAAGALTVSDAAETGGIWWLVVVLLVMGIAAGILWYR